MVTARSLTRLLRWSRIETEGTLSIDAGTFRDVLALVERAAAPSNFAGVTALAVGEAHLEDLGVNALELLPPADSFVDREWGYATSNYFAAGHRIRIDVSSSNFPRFDRNMNTGGNNYDEVKGVVAHHSVHHSAQYPSQVVLTVVRK